MLCIKEHVIYDLQKWCLIIFVEEELVVTISINPYRPMHVENNKDVLSKSW